MQHTMLCFNQHTCFPLHVVFTFTTCRTESVNSIMHDVVAQLVEVLVIEVCIENAKGLPTVSGVAAVRKRIELT